MNDFGEQYHAAQQAIASLKALVREVVSDAPDGGLRNSEIGRTLGIYSGHVEHEGHISRTLLEMLRAEGVVQQDPGTKAWTLRNHFER